MVKGLGKTLCMFMQRLSNLLGAFMAKLYQNYQTYTTWLGTFFVRNVQGNQVQRRDCALRDLSASSAVKKHYRDLMPQSTRVSYTLDPQQESHSAVHGLPTRNTPYKSTIVRIYVAYMAHVVPTREKPRIKKSSSLCFCIEALVFRLILNPRVLISGYVRSSLCACAQKYLRWGRVAPSTSVKME